MPGYTEVDTSSLLKSRGASVYRHGFWKPFLTLTGLLISVTGSLFPAGLSACKGMSCILRQGLRDA